MGTGTQARRIARKVFRRDMRLPKVVVARKHANTVGQIVRRKSGRRTKPYRRKKYGYRRKYRRY